MLEPLARVLREAREGAGVLQIDIAGRAGVSRSAVSRFETAKDWPLNPDRLVAAYEQECGVGEGELWGRAVREMLGG